MKHESLCLAVAGAMLAAGCQFQNKSTSLLPTSPSEIGEVIPNAATSSATGTAGPSSSSSSSGSTAAFEGIWASTTLPGLPTIDSCTDLQWSISSLTAKSVSGEVSATCGSVADITATLTGEMDGDEVVHLTAKGAVIALGLTCGFDLAGAGRRESHDAWRLSYSGSTCLGPVSGSEMLRRSTPAPAPQPEPEPTASPEPQQAPAPSPAPVPASGPVTCDGNTGKLIVECVERQYPSRLAGGVSLQTRTANMQFLRDRVIETAKCKGLDVGLNLKRGGPSISTDFVAWRHDGLLEGVDIGAGYDDTSKPLNLIWHTYGPPNYGFPYYKDYGSVRCN